MNSKSLRTENEELREIRTLLLESRVEVDRAAVRSMKQRLGMLTTRLVNRRDAGVSAEEAELLDEVWVFLTRLLD